jgi:hypothetical protein
MRRQQSVCGKQVTAQRAFTITDEANPNGRKLYRLARFAILAAAIS